MLNIYKLNTSIEVLAWVEAQEPPVSQMTPTDEQAPVRRSVACRRTVTVQGNRTGIASQLAESEVLS